MSYLVLARKWRPQSFDDVTGQEHVVRTLANAIARDRVAHAFLLCGPRGVGKTTTARLLARALNCVQGPTATPCGTCAPCVEITNGSSVDVVEIDGASNNGVDDVRGLREVARYMPQRDRHKIFIIDEVHMLSVAAFNALLKTLEEPPPHVKFVFATTDPQKLPETILSRCQRHNFRRVPLAHMVGRLRRICDEEEIAISERGLAQIARQADGGMRDALSLLDQLRSGSGDEIPDEAVEEALGLVDRTVVQALVTALVDRDGKAVLERVAEVHDRGVELRKLCEELAGFLRDVLVARLIGRLPTDMSDAEQKTIGELAKRSDPAQLTRLFDLVQEAARDIQQSSQPRLTVEVALLTGVHLAPAQGLADLAARLEAMAGGSAGGGGAGAGAGGSGAGGSGAGGAGGSGAAGAGGSGAGGATSQRAGTPARAAVGSAAPPARQVEPAGSPGGTGVDLVRQVEQMARSRSAPRQTGARSPAAGRSDGGDDEPPGRSPSQAIGRAPASPDDGSTFSPERDGASTGARDGAGARSGAAAAGGGVAGGGVAGGGVAGGGVAGGGVAGGASAANASAGGGGVRASVGGPGSSTGGAGASTAGASVAGAGAGVAEAGADAPVPAAPAGTRELPRGAGSASVTDGAAGMGRGGSVAVHSPGAGRGGGSSRGGSGPSSSAGAAPASSRSAPSSPARAASTPERSAPILGAADDDDEPPPPGDLDAPPGLEPERTFVVDTSPGGCATGECLADDPALSESDRWVRAIEAVKARVPIVGTVLYEARLLRLRPGEAAVGFTKAQRFHRAQLENARTQAEDVLTAHFGTSFRLRVEEASEDAPASPADEARRVREERARRLREEARSSGAVQSVLAALGGEIDDIEVLEER